MYDIIIIGGGIVGCSVLNEVSRYNLRTILLEKEEDLSCGCSKANSGIVHAGYDAVPGTLKAKFNVLGNAMYQQYANQLGVPIKNCGSLVLAKKDGLPALERLLDRGIRNGVPGLAILSRQRLLEIEPNIGDAIEYGLFAPTACIVSPYEMTIALGEQAVLNGAEVQLNCNVIGINARSNGYKVITNKGEYDAKLVINCAGYGASAINDLAGGKHFDCTYGRGDYFILDSTEYGKFAHTCFPLPDEKGKGVLVSPTADGNVILGPTSIPTNSGDDTAVGKAGLDYIRASVPNMMKNVNFGKVIRVFAGVRTVSGEDFIIRKENSHLITVAGICSPGLTSAPAIAKHVVEELLPNCGVALELKKERVARPHNPVTRQLSKEDWQKLIDKNPAYAKIVCRCEKITEGEIIDCLHSPIVPTSVDAIKRRVRAGMGRCQGGFCTQRVMDIISKQTGMAFDQVTKKGDGSQIVVGRIKEVRHD